MEDYINRAACHTALKETDLVLSDADEALTINGKNVPALELLASYWLKQGDMKRLAIMRCGCLKSSRIMISGDGPQIPCNLR